MATTVFNIREGRVCPLQTEGDVTMLHFIAMSSFKCYIREASLQATVN